MSSGAADNVGRCRKQQQLALVVGRRTVVDEASHVGLVRRRQRRDPEVVEAVMVAVECVFAVNFRGEEHDQLDAETVESDQRQAPNDPRDAHTVVTVSKTQASK